MLIEGAAYDKCTGCSKIVSPSRLKISHTDFAQVVDAYRNEGFPMLLRAFNESDYLEKLTGLDELHKESEAIMEDVDWEEGSEGSF
jgi:ubiquitin-like modifier-activating enzyme ATG7